MSPSVDDEKLAATLAAVAWGVFVALDDDYLARLRAGEDF
jgi:hypothetical protein